MLAGTTLLLRYFGLGGQYQIVGLDFGVSLLSAWLVGRAASGFVGAAGAFLSSSAAIAIGKISYGLYIYHGFTPYLLGRYVPGFVTMPAPLRVAMLTALTALIALASWRWFEQPFLRLKPALPSGTPGPPSLAGIFSASCGEVSPKRPSAAEADTPGTLVPSPSASPTSSP